MKLSRSVRKTELICQQNYNKEELVQMPSEELLELYRKREVDFELVII